MVPAKNKAKHLSSVNHTTKIIHHQHHHRLSNKKAYTERVGCFPINMLLSEIVNKFLTSAILAARITSADT